MHTESADGTRLHVETTVNGSADTALVLVHGWLGHTRWWDATRDAFAATHEIVAVDLAGHGASGARAQPSAEAYASDIVSAAKCARAKRVVVVGHSMSGAYALLAAPHIPELVRIVLVDTLKNLDQLPPPAQAEQVLAGYRADYAGAVRTILPKFLFTAHTPPAVVERLTREFLAAPGDVAAELLAPLYRFDSRVPARSIRVPVRGVGGDGGSDGVAANRAYLADYAYTTLPGCGHYPMLEQPDAFHAALRGSLS
jgi:pimeloyl-ACP methyl ester carboxylesterase|nr:alpha/beta hydrolase [Kofleriaceae bacterium]